MIVFNRTICDSKSPNFKQSVACHETGHAFGLGNVTTGEAIMNVNRDRDVIYTPHSDDVHGVEAIW